MAVDKLSTALSDEELDQVVGGARESFDFKSRDGKMKTAIFDFPEYYTEQQRREFIALWKKGQETYGRH